MAHGVPGDVLIKTIIVRNTVEKHPSLIWKEDETEDRTQSSVVRFNNRVDNNSMKMLNSVLGAVFPSHTQSN